MKRHGERCRRSRAENEAKMFLFYGRNVFMCLSFHSWNFDPDYFNEKDFFQSRKSFSSFSSVLFRVYFVTSSGAISLSLTLSPSSSRTNHTKYDVTLRKITEDVHTILFYYYYYYHHQHRSIIIIKFVQVQVTNTSQRLQKITQATNSISVIPMHSD